jgi:methyltransferase (TIGR00027 family)
MSQSIEPDGTRKSVENQASETAMATAMMRALAARDERDEIRGPDYLAELFLTEDRKALLRDAATRRWVLANKAAPGAYEFVIARTAFFDRLMAEAIRTNLPQVVLLGAGYDTRPYRLEHLLRDTRIFELDIQPTQQRKREILQKGNVSVPEHLTFVSLNFNTDDLAEALRTSGYDVARRTLFIWEGVTYYLAGQTADRTLTVVRSISPPGSSIAFDYASISPEALGEEGVRRLREHMKTQYANEPAKFGIREGTLESFLSERGYRLIAHLTPHDMEASYLTLRDGTLAGKVPTMFRLVHAEASG